MYVSVHPAVYNTLFFDISLILVMYQINDNAQLYLQHSGPMFIKTCIE